MAKRTSGRSVALLLLSLSLPLYGCNPENGLPDFVTREIDTSVLYVGGYPVVQDSVSGDRYDQFLYVDFLSNGETHDEGDRDIEVNLNSGTLENAFSSTKDSLGNVPAFYDIGKDAIRGTSYESIEEFFSDGGRVVLFTSAGRMNSFRNFLSAPIEFSRSGVVIALSTISTAGEEPSFTIANVYRESFMGYEL